MRAAHHISRLLTATFVLAAASSAFAADDGQWTVSKSSGEVWLTNTGAQPASLKQEEFLKPGDTIRTGKNGRVLLRRGEESMMIAPNSVVGVPAEKKEGLSTTIVQQAGSILLDVEKRNVKHFEVETPYLAAVVKGTQFRVTVNATSTSVDVIRGQVEVADFRTGQIAQVKPGQHATTFANGNGGLSLGGSGTLSPIEQGKPRTPSIERVPVPRAGLTAPRNTAIGQAIQTPGGPRATADKASHRASGAHVAGHGGMRISSAIGEIKLNVHKVTHGLARDKSAVHGGSRSAANKDTIWASSGSSTNSAASTGNSSNVAATSAAATAGASTSATSAVTTTTVAVVTGSGNGGGNGNNNDNDGNGNTKRNGANGGGHDNNRYGNKNGDNGNGNGNGNGHGKHR